ncbi:Membrane protein involved in the export of O-antigen and teichoic acid [Halobacillus karajensis]|uniref:Cell division protein YtgP n=1 Tax=Halobacillus karajensis TaxID=195088 RepID=A0A024P9M4_9BACI|nr:polysaccharide biosynthesis protein [Halobacillus karajensis]CDQ21783.1 putative cell division protein YtgP [Halobacillus karajensis]CDQ25779.1 putative cell division protein YtgP [Halobacillus karajensis]CDQ29780.1 putative cell division protein YtgP [Halobacillus karajensis]SEI12427.1 Membrane protein involved in the export of O-antigen and teichoic acid [Halobacillus karajensis]
MTKLRSRSILKGAFILTLAGVISKIISAGYRVPLQNLTGDMGFYVYQQVYPILGIALILALYGFPAAISKIVSEIGEDQSSLSVPSFFLPVFGWLMAASGLIFIVGYTQSAWIASLMGDEQLTPSLKAAFSTFLLVPFVSIIRGVFQGKNDMTPTAVSQIIEQIFRVGVIICTAVFVMQGAEVYAIGVGASLGSIIGALAAFVILFYWIARKDSIWSFHRWQNHKTYKRTIFLHGILICLNYMLLLSLQLVDALTMIPSLLKAGVALDDARIMKGVFDRGQPLIQLGTVLASSLALALIPSVTRTRMNRHPEKVIKSIISAVKVTVFISLGATAGLIFLFPAINQSFFENGQGTGELRVLMLVILGSSISITLSSVLQGLNYIKHTAMIILGGIVVKWAGNMILIPIFDIYGAAMASTIAVAFVLVGNIVTLRHEVPWKKWMPLPWRGVGLSLLGMVISLWVMKTTIYVFFDLDGRLLLLIYTLSLTGIGALTYLVLLLRLGCFTKEEIQTLPSHKVLAKFLPKGMNQ